MLIPIIYSLTTNMALDGGRSCETQLAGLVDELAKSLDNKGQTDLIILDFSKAFDKVPHKKLLYKLNQVGIDGNILKWIETFLTTRHQRVLLEGEMSADLSVTSGVPQGTVMGPLLFLLYINDMPNVVRSNVRLFADDAIIYREISNQDDSLSLQKDLDALCEWSKAWQMSFNTTKCHAMHVTHKTKPLLMDYNMDGHTLLSVNHHPYLGIELSKDINWATHINQVANKANKILGLLKRNLNACSTTVKGNAYKSLVRPKLEYCGAIWDPYKNNNKSTIEKVQRRAARFVLNDYKRKSSVNDMLTALGWETLELRRIRLRLITIYKETHQITPSNLQVDEGPKTPRNKAEYWPVYCSPTKFQ